MTYFEKTIKYFLATMACLFLRSYIVNPDKNFIRNRKISYRDCIKYIIWNKGRNNDIEAEEFCKLFFKKKYESFTQQAVGKQRMKIKPKLFIRIYKEFINLIYNNHRDFSKFKGYIVCACDGSIFDLPNVRLTHKEFNTTQNIFKNEKVRARVSGMMDVKSKFMLTTKIVEKSVSEIELAMEHLDDLNSRFNIKEFIGVFDRAYKSIELMLYTENYESKFVIRLPKNVFAKQRRQIKGNDKIISINLNNSVIKNFEKEEMKEFAKKIGRYELRIVEIKLLNGTVEYLATNLDQEEFSLEDLRELYGQRWNIETGFKKLKSQIQIESFSGYRRTIIEQDFYAKIFLYNLATAIQWDAEQQIEIK